MKIRHFVLAGFCATQAMVAATVQIHFDELGTSPAINLNNLHTSGVLFNFSGGSAVYNGSVGTSGAATLVSDPLLVGDTSGALTLTFDFPTDFLQFDIAMASGNFIQNAYTVTIPGTAPISGDTTPILIISEGSFFYSGTPFSQAVITFSNAAPQFGLDNLTFDPPAAAPEPGTLLFMGTALFGLAAFLRRSPRA
jgi:PEP-CTERM motif